MEVAEGLGVWLKVVRYYVGAMVPVVVRALFHRQRSGVR